MVIFCSLPVPSPCAYVHDTVGINIKGNFDLRHAPRCSGDTAQFETAKGLVVGCHFTFALENMDVNGRLIIRSRREDLLLGGWDGRVAVNDPGERHRPWFQSQGKAALRQEAGRP